MKQVRFDDLERKVEVLKKRGQFKDGQSVIGLKKTKPDE